MAFYHEIPLLMVDSAERQIRFLILTWNTRCFRTVFFPFCEYVDWAATVAPRRRQKRPFDQNTLQIFGIEKVVHFL
jgi:hypothetical protein